ITEVKPNIFAVIIPNGFDRAMTFCRVQEFYESPNPQFRGKHFSMWDYMKWYSKEYDRGFSYPNDWSGFNIPFEVITPNIQTFTPGLTNINCSVRTVRGTSPGGSETSYIDSGYESISLNDTHTFDNTKIIASRVNENEYLDSMIGNKSLSMRLDLQSNNENISPLVDLDRSNIVLVSNNINNPISNYSTNPNVNTLDSDPHECVYLSKKVKLLMESTGIKVVLDAYKPVGTNIRVLFSTNNSNDTNKDFELFPGYSNINRFGNIIDSKNNDGTSDKFINFSKPNEFKLHEFTNLNVDSFTELTIKIVMTSINSSVVPRIKNLKVLTLA
ncbi:hypothetical protein EB169_10645, partial [archaeon]|nr:hypothetical protein [archaeon]